MLKLKMIQWLFCIVFLTPWKEDGLKWKELKVLVVVTEKKPETLFVVVEKAHASSSLQS